MNLFVVTAKRVFRGSNDAIIAMAGDGFEGTVLSLIIIDFIQCVVNRYLFYSAALFIKENNAGIAFKN
jgi:hypothetical protein